ncbi:MAG: sugar phosphate isomerase/epimerase [Candidatus Brockarchaeota archaeon]|nr:sugar phosphate isomerase/epimerase [Candidatus Brockarchaeota archaeon]
MRLGGPAFKHSDPASWVSYLRSRGYSAAFCPVGSGSDRSTVRAYVEAAEESGILIAEVGVWNNPISPDRDARIAAIRRCQEQLALAEDVGARCCVNISGSRGGKWDGPHPDNLSKSTFDLVVETVQEIIDAVKPVKTCYTLETMPWTYPDSADSYLELIKAVNRKEFAVHFDPVNLVCSPRRYYYNGGLIRDFCSKLGPYIKSCHAKDVRMREDLLVHLEETRPGLGGLDYGVYLEELGKLDPDTPLMIEHLESEEEYSMAASYIRSVAEKARVRIR